MIVLIISFDPNDEISRERVRFMSSGKYRSCQPSKYQAFWNPTRNDINSTSWFRSILSYLERNVTRIRIVNESLYSGSTDLTCPKKFKTPKSVGKVIATTCEVLRKVFWWLHSEWLNNAKYCSMCRSNRWNKNC